MGRWYFGLPRSSHFVLLGWLLVELVLAGLAPAAAQRHHTVQSGQTLSGIAKRYRVAAWDLALANKLTPQTPLRVGQTLEVPPDGVTYVRPGQTLSHIARAHGCTVQELQRLNDLKNAAQLRQGSRIRLPGYMPAVRHKRDWGEPAAPGVVRLQRWGEQLELRLVDSRGRVLESGLQQLARAMRRHEDDPVELPHPRLAHLLATISDHFGGRPLSLVSGFRVEGGYTGESSRHLAGRAADIQVQGVPRRVVWEYCRSLNRTGCGYYPRSVFVHVDVREGAAQWVDWSAPGKRPRYGTLRRPYRRRERNHPGRPRESRRVTRPAELPLLVHVVGEKGNILRVADDRAPRTQQDASATTTAQAGSASYDSEGS